MRFLSTTLVSKRIRV